MLTTVVQMTMFPLNIEQYFRMLLVSNLCEHLFFQKLSGIKVIHNFQNVKDIYGVVLTQSSNSTEPVAHDDF